MLRGANHPYNDIYVSESSACSPVSSISMNEVSLLKLREYITSVSADVRGGVDN